MSKNVEQSAHCYLALGQIATDAEKNTVPAILGDAMIQADKPRMHHGFKYLTYPLLALFISLLAEPAFAAASIKVGNFNKSTAASPASQTITHGLGETPKALILWTASFQVDGAFRQHLRFGFGISDGTSSKAVAVSSEDAQQTTIAGRRQANKALTILGGTSTVFTEATLVSWDQNTFTLNWTTNSQYNYAYIIHYMIIGGSDVSAKVIGWQTPTVVGNKAVTGLGFQPDLVLHAHSGNLSGGLPLNSSHGSIGLGAMNSIGEQWANSILTVSNMANSDTQRVQQTDGALVSTTASLGLQYKASYVSMDSDGFTVNFTTAPTSASNVVSLALKGLQTKIGSFDKTTASAPAAQSITGVGFQPNAVLFSSVQDIEEANPVSHTRFGLGASDGTNEGAAAFQDTSGLSASSVEAIDKTGKAFLKVNNNTPAIDAEVDLTGLNSDGFTLDWTTNDAVATQVLYLALAPATAPGSATKLAVTSINGGNNPSAGVSFPVVVQAQNAGGVAANVAVNTEVNLSLKTGTGTLGGTLTGTISAGTNQVTISGVTYTTAETGVVLTATRTSGDVLTAGDSAGFTVNPGGSIYQASADFSSTQGYQQWSYLDSTGAQLTYDGANSRWQGVETYLIIGSGSMHPGKIRDAVRRWTAPENGSVHITGVARDTAVTGGDGVIVYIRKNGANLWSATINNGNTVGFSFDVTTSVAVNDRIDFVVDARSNESYDSTAFDPTIEFTPSSVSPIKLAVLTINGGVNPTAGVPYAVVVQAQDASGVARNVATNTAVSLSLKTGTGTLSGTLTGTISAGTNQVTISGVTYTKAESGIVLTATRTSGDTLTAGDSAGFVVNPAAAAKLAFTTQPGNSISGTTIAGPPTVSVQDNLGNTVTTSTALITVAISSNPGGSTLNGTTTRNASFGIAAFTGLSITQAGTGYTLAATSSGLTGATSTTFNITSSPVTLAATPGSVPAGDSFTVTWSQIPNPTSRDWIALYSPGSSDTSYLAWRYVNCSTSPTVPMASGSCSFPIASSLSPGTYEFRLLPNDTYTHIATSNSVTVTTAVNKLAISVGQNVTAGTGFSMTVVAKSPSGVATNVSTNTLVTVSVKTGTGNLGGTVNGTILAGTSQVTIGSATYTKAESGVVLTAARNSGDTLIAGDTAPFTVSPGAPTQLGFTTQPGNAAINSPIPGPPTVTVQDSTGNTVTAATQSISIAIGTNPNAGTLDGNTTLISSSSVTFADLNIDKLGNGYTLTASAPGLLGATSNPFNITSPTGTGIIAGVITRVSNGATISGALVEALQGTALRGTAVTNSSGNYSITGLAAGSYTVQASYTGLVPQVVNNVGVTAGNTTTVNSSLNFGIAVQSPVAGATINDFSVLVTGLFDASLAPEVGIKVNGAVALQNGDEFATIVPIDSQTTTLTATITNTAGTTLATDIVPITPQVPNDPSALFFRPYPAIASVSQPVTFTLTSVNPFTQLQLDGNGDGTIDYSGTTLQGVSVSFAESGLYFPTVSVTEAGGPIRTATSIVQVFDSTQLDTMLQNKWTAMKNALRSGDVSGAVNHIVMRRRATYEAMFNALTVPLANIDQVLHNITLLDQRGIEVEYEMMVNQGGVQRSFMVLFAIDEDGVWRVKFF